MRKDWYEELVKLIKTRFVRVKRKRIKTPQEKNKLPG